MKSDFFSKRTNWNLDQNELSSLLNGIEHGGAAVLDLTESNPTECEFNLPIKEVLAALIKSENLKYQPDPKGMLKTREAIAAFYQTRNLTVSPDQIFLTSSTSEGYSHIFRLMCNPKEIMLFPRPSYPLFQFLVDINDLQAEFYPLEYRERWRINFPSLEYFIKSNTRGIVLVNPNNPTGNYIISRDLERLNKIAKENNLFLLSDEVFYDFHWKQEIEKASLIGNSEILSFTLGGLSKTLGLPQMKLSWIIVDGPKDLRKEAISRLEVITDTYLSVNSPVQNALPDWLKLADQFQCIFQERIKQNKKMLDEYLSDTSICRMLVSEGGWYAVLQIDTQKSEEEIVAECLTQENVLVHPGYFFDFEGEPYVVLSLITAPEKFQEGVRRILTRLS